MQMTRVCLGSYEEECMFESGWIDGGLGKFNGGFESKRAVEV